MPDVILQLTNFVDTGDSPFTSDMLLRALGFLLGIGMALIVAAVFRTLRTPDIRRAFTAAALIVAILQLVMHATELFSLVLILLHNHELWMTYAQALAFLIPAVASIIIGLRTTPNGCRLPGDAAIPPLNEAGVRARIAFRRRAVAAGAWSMAAAIALTALLAWGTYELNKQPVISEPEEYSLVDGVATIPFSQVEDGHLHRARTASAWTPAKPAATPATTSRTAKSSANAATWRSTWPPSGSKAAATPYRSPTRSTTVPSPSTPPTLMRCPRTSNNERRFRCSSCA